jgi:hypothetical protein
MAHDFLGTFNKSQWDRFVAFARTQVDSIPDRLDHLDAEINRVGRITFVWDGGVPSGFSASPGTSYLAKLLAAYEVLGGSPQHDLRTRLLTEPVVVLPGDPNTAPHTMSNGEVIGAKGLGDGATALLSRQAQSWLLETLHWRYGRLERKIRRALDYKDQLTEEQQRLQLISQAATVPDSFEHIAEQVYLLFDDPQYRAIFDDKGADPYGLTAYAPFSAYDRETSELPELVQRTGGGPQRQNTGFVPKGGVA